MRMQTHQLVLTMHSDFQPYGGMFGGHIPVLQPSSEPDSDPRLQAGCKHTTKWSIVTQPKILGLEVPEYGKIKSH